MIDVSPRNIVCSGSVGAAVPLDTITGFDGAEHDPVAFPGVRFRLGCTVILFSSGSVVSVGADTERAALGAVDELVCMLRRRGVRTGRITRRICNVVATADLGHTLDLGRVVLSIPRSMYEPEHFPGAVICRLDPKCTILLFASGRLVCVGADSVAGASSAVNGLHADLAAGGLLD